MSAWSPVDEVIGRRAGVPRSVAMKMVSHKTEAIYRRYATVSDADL